MHPTHAPCPLGPRFARGVHLTELLVVIAVLAVLASLALPSLGGALEQLQSDRLRMQLHSALNQARATALSRRRTIGICASSDGLICGEDWSHGWMLYQPGQDSSTVPILHQALTPRRRLAARNSTGRPTLEFRADGRSLGRNARILICQREHAQAEVVVSNTGRVRSQRLDGDSGC
ncbi:GspH/FimT family pseudopilin [Stenotrophomonas sp. TD3]|uniref:GspH/FimT family pseudopilin n=1 Tax=Stenotrophomonas sp. TD3 TaxID=1641707 RepID=UPI000951CF37|nr:GspH/FimT family pseudopilin [Stenotrophomonas sp. TD3]